MIRPPTPITISLLVISSLLLASAVSGQEGGEDEFRAFEADIGPAYIDVSSYPPEQQTRYALFAQKCSKCHTLARPINSTMVGDEWWGYINRMSRKPGSGISPTTADEIFVFLSYDSTVRARRSNVVDPELLPFLEVSRELGGVSRIPASMKNVVTDTETLRLRVEGDRRLNLKHLFLSDEAQKVTRWTQRNPNRAELQVVATEVIPGPEPKDNSTEDAEAVAEAIAEAVTVAIGTETDPREQVELLLDWLDESIERVHRPGDNDAESALSAGQGDATEFTRIFCALAEGAGLDVQSRVGLVARRTAFHFHCWAEVWLDGWVPVDPYLGQLPADITHLRLTGDRADGLTAWDPTRYAGLDRLRLVVVIEEEESGTP